MKLAAPANLPAAYFALLAFSNGGEGELSKEPLWFQLDSAEYAAEAARSGLHKEFFDGFFIFGSNGGGEFIAFDLRGGVPFPVVYIDMVAGPESAALVAANFDAFIDLIGIEAE